MTLPDTFPKFVDAATSLAEAEAVVARLVPLTRPIETASPDLQEHLASAWFRRIDALRTLDRPADVLTTVDALCAHFEPNAGIVVAPGAGAPLAWPWIARALCEKAMALIGMGQREDALALVQQVQQRFGNAQTPALREWVATAGLEEARLRASAGATFARVDMVRHCQDLIGRFGRDEAVATQVVVARTRAWQARLLSELDYDEEALKNYTALHDDFRAATDPALQEQAAYALLAKARLFRALDRRTEAFATLQALVDTYADVRHPEVRQTLALAQMDQAFHLQFSRIEGSGGSDADTAVVAACDALLAAHEGSTDAIVLRCVNQALRLKAEVLRENDDSPDSQAQADAVTELQWAQYAGHPDERVQKELLLAMLDRLTSLGHPEQELAGYRMLLDHFGGAQAGLLQAPLARTRVLEAWALRALDRTDEALAALALLDARHGASMDPAVRLQCVNGAVERGRILRGVGDFTAALAALEVLPDTGDDASAPLRKAIARALDLRAELWKDQAPEAHPRRDGKDEAGAPIETVATDGELRYAEAVDALVERFAADPSGEIRSIAADALYGLAVHWRGRLQFQRSVDAYANYLHIFAADTRPAIEKTTASAYLNQAYTLMMLMGRDAEALTVYDTVMERFAQATGAGMRDTLAKAAASRLTCLNRLQRQGEAVNYGDQYEDLSLGQRDAITATIERGRVLSVQGKHREAIACYDEVLDVHVDSLHPELRRQCLDAMVRKGYCLGCLAQREAALAVNDEIIARYGNDLSTTTEKDVALAMSNRAVQLDKLGRHDEEVQTYDRIIERWQASDVAYLRQRVASARFCKALTIADTDLEGALALYAEVMATSLHAPDAAVRLEGAKSAVNRSIRLRTAGRLEEAIASGETLLQACQAETDIAIAAQVVKARVALARAYGQAGQVARQRNALEVLLALPASALTEAQRAEMRAEYRKIKPTSTVIGQAAHALGRWWGKRS